MPRLVSFQIHCEDLDRAQAFYEAMFGWRIEAVPGVDFRMVITGEGPGVNGGLVKRMGALDQDASTPVNAWVCTIGVDDIDSYIGRAKALGARLALAKQTTPRLGSYAYYRDSEGNVFGLFQAAPGAGWPRAGSD